MSAPINPDPNSRKSWYATDRGRLIGIAAGATLIIGASFSVQAIAESKPYQHMKLLMGSEQESTVMIHKAGWGERGWFRGGRHGRGHGSFADLTDAEIEKRITRVVKHVAIEIDATQEQQTRITTLITAVAKDLRPLRNEFRAAGKEMHELLTADKIDREAIEKLRAERLAEADRISKEMVTALADVAEVLTVEQRKVLDERIEQFRSMRKRWHRG